MSLREACAGHFQSSSHTRANAAHPSEGNEGIKCPGDRYTEEKIVLAVILVMREDGI